MSKEDKRKLYSCGSKYVTLDEVETWQKRATKQSVRSKYPSGDRLVLLRFHIWSGRSISVRFSGKNRGFGTVRFLFYYTATVCGYGAGRNGDKISQTMGGGWARSAR